MSAATAEAELLRVGGWRRRIITREAGVTKARGTAGYRLEHPVQTEIAERIGAHFLRDLFDRHVGRDQLLARRSVDTIVAGTGDGRRADTEMNFARTGGADHVDEAARGCTADDRIIDHHHALVLQNLANRIVLDLHLGVAARLRRLKKGSADVVIADQRELEWQSRFLGKSQRRGVG